MQTQNKQKTIKTFTAQYFKRSGKFYTEGTFDLEVTVLDGGTVCMPEVFDHLQSLRAHSNLPGLNSNGAEFTIYISHEDGYPGLIFPVA